MVEYDPDDPRIQAYVRKQIAQQDSIQEARENQKNLQRAVRQAEYKVRTNQFFGRSLPTRFRTKDSLPTSNVINSSLPSDRDNVSDMNSFFDKIALAKSFLGDRFKKRKRR